MAQFLGSPKVQFFKTGTVDYLSAGKLYSYAAGTTTPTNTYPTIADAQALTNANTNPVILDSRGEANVVLAGSTKLILKDSLDNVIWTVDNVGASSSDILDANGNELIRFAYVASAVNEVTVTNSVTGSAPSISATGGDTDINLTLIPKGTGVLNLSGDAPSITAFGSDTNLNIDLVPKGSGVVKIKGGNALDVTGSGANLGLNLITSGTGTLQYNGTTIRPIIQRVYNSSGAYATTTSAIPLDNSIPQITEGSEYITVSITPTSATNILEIKASIPVSGSTALTSAIALFQDATANALTASVLTLGGAGYAGALSVTYTMIAGTTSATTFRTRVGTNTGTIYVNGISGSAIFGGTANAYIVVTEYKV